MAANLIKTHWGRSCCRWCLSHSSTAAPSLHCLQQHASSSSLCRQTRQRTFIDNNLLRAARHASNIPRVIKYRDIGTGQSIEKTLNFCRSRFAPIQYCVRTRREWIQLWIVHKIAMPPQCPTVSVSSYDKYFLIPCISRCRRSWSGLNDWTLRRRQLSLAFDLSPVRLLTNFQPLFITVANHRYPPSPPRLCPSSSDPFSDGTLQTRVDICRAAHWTGQSVEMARVDTSIYCLFTFHSVCSIIITSSQHI